MDSSSSRRSDFYVELMRDSRGLVPEHSEARERWFDDLEVADKEEALFELEMLLKGLVCFADPANQPGPSRREPAVTRQYRDEVRIIRAGCERVAELCRHLLGADEDSGLFANPLRRPHRDHLKERLLKEPVDQDTPEASLRLLSSGFSDLGVLTEALTRTDHVPFQVFASLGRVVGREIERNLFFNPLVQLEFRPELDRITHVELLEIVYGTRPPGAKRAVTLTFLALLRIIRYLEVAGRMLSDPARGRSVFLPLAAARNDGRALSRFLGRDSRGWIADGFDQDLLSLRARELPEELPRLRADFDLLKRLGAVLHATGDRLSLEIRRVFERELPAVEASLTAAETVGQLEEGLVRLAGFLKACVVSVGQVFDGGLSGHRLFVTYPSPGDEAEELRQDLWMFAQILRGFLAKASASPVSVGSWEGVGSYRFVREYITYFRNFGCRVVRASGYLELEEYEALTSRVFEAEEDRPDLLEELFRRSTELHDFVLHSIEELSQSPELENKSLDRREAAETLRLYLDR